MTDALIPSSSASFALTLDQNVSRDVRNRVLVLEKRTRRAGVISWIGVAGVAIGSVGLASIEPALILLAVYGGLFALPIAPAIWGYARKASRAASRLNQDRDVAFVGKDGLVFFADDGFFIEKQGGWKPWGVREPSLKRYDDVEYFAGNRVLTVSSSSGYGINIRVPPGWTERDTERVRLKMNAFEF